MAQDLLRKKQENMEHVLKNKKQEEQNRIAKEMLTKSPKYITLDTISAEQQQRVTIQ
jgi:hypothetical protein